MDKKPTLININGETKVLLSVSEYEKMQASVEQYNEVFKNISDRILAQNLEAYKELAGENWDK